MLELNKIHQMDCLSGLKLLPDNSIDCCVTSPPYFGLRSYLENEDREIGKEKTLPEYIANLVEIFEEVRRVLKPTGTCWINIGDSYSGSGKGRNPDGTTHTSALSAKQGTNGSVVGNIKGGFKPDGIKRKELMNVPHRLVFALSDAGWYHRQTIIWAKATSGLERNGSSMPESVTDRFSQSFEYVFLLTKKDKYFFDAHAVKEPINNIGKARPYSTKKQTGNRNDTDRIFNPDECDGLANMRNVWRINLQPGSSGQHIAGYPEKLVEPCVKAGTSEYGCCKDCGKPYERILEKTGDLNVSWAPGTRDYHKLETSKGRHGETSSFMTDTVQQFQSKGWQKTCKCETDEVVPSIVLDVFMGSGTTAFTALKLGRNFIGFELNSKYIEFANDRIKFDKYEKRYF